MPSPPLSDPHFHGLPPYAPPHEGSHHHHAGSSLGAMAASSAAPAMTPMSLPTQPSQTSDAPRAGDIVAGMADLELSQRTPLDFGDGGESQPFMGDFKTQDESQLTQEPGSIDDYLKTQNLPFTQ